MTTKRISGKSILATALGWDFSEIHECRYQGYTSPTVCVIGDDYFAVSRTRPKHDVGNAWVEHVDEGATQGTAMKIWVSRV